MTAFAIGSSTPEVNIMALADAMETKGYKIERNQYPDSIHCTIMPHHIPIVEDLLKALADSVEEVKVHVYH